MSQHVAACRSLLHDMLRGSAQCAEDCTWYGYLERQCHFNIIVRRQGYPRDLRLMAFKKTKGTMNWRGKRKVRNDRDGSSQKCEWVWAASTGTSAHTELFGVPNNFWLSWTMTCRASTLLKSFAAITFELNMLESFANRFFIDWAWWSFWALLKMLQLVQSKVCGKLLKAFSSFSSFTFANHATEIGDRCKWVGMSCRMASVKLIVCPQSGVVSLKEKAVPDNPDGQGKGLARRNSSFEQSEVLILWFIPLE